MKKNKKQNKKTFWLNDSLFVYILRSNPLMMCQKKTRYLFIQPRKDLVLLLQIAFCTHQLSTRSAAPWLKANISNVLFIWFQNSDLKHFLIKCGQFRKSNNSHYKVMMRLIVRCKATTATQGAMDPLSISFSNHNTPIMLLRRLQ